MLNVWRSEHIRNLPDAMTSVARRSLAISKRTERERERGGESFSLRGLGSLAFHAWNEIRLAIEPTFQHFASSILFKLGWISLNSEWMNSEEKTRQGFVASVVRWSTIHSRVVLLQVMERERKREKKDGIQCSKVIKWFRSIISLCSIVGGGSMNESRNWLSMQAA